MGTLPPPISLSEADEKEWAGGYLSAGGQEMLREDARRFGEALERSGLAGFEDLREFSHASGFLIASTDSETPTADDLQALYAETRSAVRVREIEEPVAGPDRVSD